MFQAFFSALFQAFLGLFGESDQENLGRLKVQKSEDDALIKEMKAKNDTTQAVNGLSNSDVINILSNEFPRK
jgi:hypothetical protein